MASSPVVRSKQFSISVAITVALSIAAMVALHFEWIGFGLTLFIALPIAIGCILGQRGFGISLIFSGIVGLVVFFFLIIAGGLEAFICVLLASPIIIICMLGGMIIGVGVRRILFDDDQSMMRISLYPILLVAIAGPIEHYFTTTHERGELVSEVLLAAPPEKVYDYIKSVDTLATADKPLLLRVGMPVPYKCVLDNESIGGKRTCYFDGGVIEEQLTDLRRGELIKMKVTRVTLPLQRWITFDDAIYMMESRGDSTLLRRITTYQTTLKPRFYWSFWEQQAIEAEHNFVFHDLANRLANSPQP